MSFKRQRPICRLSFGLLYRFSCSVCCNIIFREYSYNRYTFRSLDINPPSTLFDVVEIEIIK